MHFSANPDRPAASCVICAKQLPDREQACPYCSEGPFIDESSAQEDDWLNAVSASDEAASDPVLDAMMAIASSKATRTSNARSMLVEPSQLIPEQAVSGTDVGASQQATTPHRSASNRRLESPTRRMVFGCAVMAISAGLTGAQWQTRGPGATQSQEPMPVAHDIGPLAQAAAIAPSATPDPAVRARMEPVPEPKAEAPPAPATGAPDGAPRDATCSEALLALALCREPL